MKQFEYGRINSALQTAEDFSTIQLNIPEINPIDIMRNWLMVLFEAKDHPEGIYGFDFRPVYLPSGIYNCRPVANNQLVSERLVSINYNDSLIEEHSISFNSQNSWIGSVHSDQISFYQDLYSTQQVDITVTRNNQMPTNGWGQIGTFSFTMKDDISGKTQLIRALDLWFSNVMAISELEADIPIYYGTNETIYISQYALNAENTPANVAIEMHLFPNPVSDYLSMQFTGFEPMSVEITNVLGQQMFSSTTRFNNIDVRNWKSGLYLVAVKDQNNQVIIQKVMIEK